MKAIKAWDDILEWLVAATGYIAIGGLALFVVLGIVGNLFL
jgi:hypothetical protein